MYKLLKEVKKSIKSFKVNEKGELCYLTSKGELYSRGQLISKRKDIDSLNYFQEGDSIFYGSNQKFEYYINNLTSGEVVIIEDKAFISSGLGGGKALMYSQKNGSFIVSYNNLFDGSLEFAFGEYINIIEASQKKEYLYLRIDDSIILKYTKEGQKLWNFNASQLGNFISSNLADKGEEKTERIHALAGIHEGYLYLGLASGKIIALEIQTGQLVKEWSKMKRPHPLFNGIPTGNLRLDKEKGEIFCILNTYCWKIDLKTEELSFYDFEEYLRKEKISFNAIHSSIYGNYIIGLASKELNESDEYNTPYIIALNRNTFKKEWEYQLDIKLLDQEGATTAPIFQGNYMYCALNGTLHIFEKEEKV